MPVQRVCGDYEQLHQIAEAFSAEAEQQQAQLKRLWQAKNLLLAGDWVGLGAREFYTEMNTEVFPALQRLIKALRQAQRVTEQISGVMQQAEAAAAECFQV